MIGSIRNMTARDTGEEEANKFVIKTTEGTYFQSFQSIICFIPTKLVRNPTLLSPVWDVDPRTKMFCCDFLNKTEDEIRYAIKSGEILTASIKQII